MENIIIQAQTFTPIYSQSEDRIRLVINYADFQNRIDLWLTRGFLLKLIPTIEDYLDKYDTTSDKEVQQKIEESVQTKTDAPTLTMTEKEGFLVHTVDISYNKEEQQISLIFKTLNHQVISIVSLPLLRTILKSIFSAIPKIDWGISPQWVR